MTRARSWKAIASHQASDSTAIDFAADCQSPLRIDVGCYVLGALDGTQAERVRRHLRACVSCRAIYRELAELPALLARLSEADVTG